MVEFRFCILWLQARSLLGEITDFLAMVIQYIIPLFKIHVISISSIFVITFKHLLPFNRWLVDSFRGKFQLVSS